MRLLLFLLACGGVACADATEPKAFTLGPGCVGQMLVVQQLRDGSGTMIATIRAHWPKCPEPMPNGWTLAHMDTTYVP